MKKISVVAVLIMLVSVPAFSEIEHVSLTATGYEWLGYDKDHKRAFAGMLHIVLNVKKGSYDPEKVIKSLDDFYRGAIEEAKADPLHVDEDKYLKVRCVDVIRGQLDCKAEIMKDRQAQEAAAAARTE